MILALLFFVSVSHAGTVVELKGLHVTGSGTYVRGSTGRNLILTNWHVCRNDSVMIVKEFGQSETLARMVHSDRAIDLCVLDPQFKREPFDLGLIPTYKETLTNIKRNLTRTTGHVYQTTTQNFFGYSLVLQDTDIEAHAGDSGSPVIDSMGRIVGIMESTIWNRWGSMIPLFTVKLYLEKF